MVVQKTNNGYHLAPTKLGHLLSMPNSELVHQMVEVIEEEKVREIIIIWQI